MRHSFIELPADHPFPLQNLPYGVFSTATRGPRIGVAIGDFILDLKLLENEKLLPCRGLFQAGALNHFMAAGPAIWQAVRETLLDLLDEKQPRLRDHPTLRRDALVPRAEATMHLPAHIGHYTDFMAAKHHVLNVGEILTGTPRLPPSWLHLPVAYHGRASSVVVSGTPVRRPRGQVKAPGAEFPELRPCGWLDFELELGFFIGPGNALGEPIDVRRAHEHVFGAVLLNDWSARDLQWWESVPLGPFLSKNFCTSISPWVVPLAALDPFRVPAPTREVPLLPYLDHGGARTFDLALEVSLQTEKQASPSIIARTNARELYWDISQQIAHHTINGCNLQPGDLLGTGTISGAAPASQGCLVELTRQGAQPLTLPSGEHRGFLEDGDTVNFSAAAQGDGYRVGFGELAGRVLPAPTG